MSVKPAKIQFNGGELSPWLYGRTDIEKYDKTARLCRNFIPLTEGSLKRRGGTRFAAQTPQSNGVTFQIICSPAEAVVKINDEIQSLLVVAIGDTVNYTVQAPSYTSVSGKVVVTDNMILRVNLVSLVEQRTLTIVANPENAVIKIKGYQRSQYTGALNEKVAYVVYCDGYLLQSGQVVLDQSKTINVTLTAEESDDGTYGDWGDPVAFIACTAYGQKFPQKKCFLIYFENGYLPILFDDALAAPKTRDVDESLFIYNNSNGYDALVRKNNTNQLAVIRRTSKAIYYDNLQGQMIAGFDFSSMKYYGWQRDESGKYASVYKLYDGYVVGKTVKVYENGNLVWTLRGRNNG